MPEQRLLSLPEAELDPQATQAAANALEDAEAAGKWAGRLLEIIDGFEAELARCVARSLTPRQTAEALTLFLAQNQGGRHCYLPTGKRLRDFLRDREIYKQFDGFNHAELAKRYQLIDGTIYRIIARMTALERRKRQSNLF